MFKAQIAVLHLHCHGCIWILFWQGGDFVKVLHLPRLPGLTSLVSVCAGIPWSGGPTPLLQRFHHIIITFMPFLAVFWPFVVLDVLARDLPGLSGLQLSLLSIDHPSTKAAPTQRAPSKAHIGRKTSRGITRSTGH